MYCINCGNKLDKDAKFCKECGTKTSRVIDTSEEITNRYIPKSKGLATASMILGIISLLLGFIIVPLPIIGLVLGLCQKGRCGEKVAGIVLNAFALFIIVLTWFLVFVFIGFTNVDYQAREDNYGNSDVIVNDNVEENHSLFNYIFD